MTVAEAIRSAVERLSATSDTARLDAEILMAHALGMSRSDLLLRAMQRDVPGGFETLVERRAAKEPVAYIIGVQEFYGREFAVGPGVLIPRGDSEILVEAALDLCPDPHRVLDLGIGSGALLLTVLAERPGAVGVGVDSSAEAIGVARKNATALGVVNEPELLRRDWSEPGWCDGLGKFDLVLCNPPYVETGAQIDPDVRDFEPAQALFSGPEGLDDYRVIIPQLGKFLAENGLAALEIGARQAESVTEIARKYGFSVEMRCDLANRPRVLILRA